MQTVFFHAVELFCFCLALHIVIWRLFPRLRQFVQLALIFFFYGPALLFGLSALVSVLVSGVFPSLDWPSWGLAGLLHASLTAVYINLYTLAAGASPSIGILERVDASMPHGLERRDLAPPWFNDKNLSGARRENLLASGFIYETGGLLQLSPRGLLLARCYLKFRRFLGLSDVAKG